MSLSDQEIQEIIDRVHRRMGDVPAGSQPGATLAARADLDVELDLGDGIFATIDDAVGAAKRAQVEYAKMGLKTRHNIVDGIRRSMFEHAESLARLAHTETGLGRYEDKVKKNLLVTTKTPGPEDLEPQAVTGDGGMSVTEWAPMGLVGAITPTTNPTSTIINNSISILSGGNAAVFNVHPGAKRVSAENIRLINRAVVANGGPAHLADHRG